MFKKPFCKTHWVYVAGFTINIQCATLSALRHLQGQLLGFSVYGGQPGSTDISIVISSLGTLGPSHELTIFAGN